MRRCLWIAVWFALSACGRKDPGSTASDPRVERSSLPGATAAATTPDPTQTNRDASVARTSLAVRTDCNGKGCGKASITVSLENSSSSKYADSRGMAAFTDLPAGGAVVSVRDDKDPRHPIFGEEKIALSGGASSVTVRTSVLNADATVHGFVVERDGTPPARIPGSKLVVEASCPTFDRSTVVSSSDGSFAVVNLVPGECSLTCERLDDPPGPLDGNGMHSFTKVVAPATGVRVEVNDFRRRSR